MLITVIVFLLILSVLVLIHELGHFLVAKKLGIKVEEFGFGFPPRAFGIQRGETMYSINWLPIGGFVKLYGEDEAGGGRLQVGKSASVKDKDLKRAFFARPPRERAMVAVAGVVMNVFLAALIYYIFLGLSNFKTEIPLLEPHRFFLVNQKNTSDIVINTVTKNSPAEKAGVKPFAKITAVNGLAIKNIAFFLSVVNENKGKQVTITWQDLRSGKTFQGKVVPRKNPPKGEGALGIVFFASQTARLSYDTLSQKVFSGFIHPANLLVYNFDLMKKLVAVSIAKKTAAPLSQGVTGPVGIYSLVGTIVQIPDIKERVLQALNLAGLLSMSLAFFNVLPIPALDGGRLFFILIEWASGRKINQKIEEYIHTAGMILLLTLIALITIQDFRRLIFGF